MILFGYKNEYISLAMVKYIKLCISSICRKSQGSGGAILSLVFIPPLGTKYFQMMILLLKNIYGRYTSYEMFERNQILIYYSGCSAVR